MKPELVSSVGSRLPDPGPCSVAVAPEPAEVSGIFKAAGSTR
jgi:hypothetical protein